MVAQLHSRPVEPYPLRPHIVLNQYLNLNIAGCNLGNPLQLNNLVAHALAIPSHALVNFLQSATQYGNTRLFVCLRSAFCSHYISGSFQIPPVHKPSENIVTTFIHPKYCQPPLDIRR